MAKPKVIDVKRPPAPAKKPRVVGQKDKDDDYSLLLDQVDEPSQELRREQLKDLKPRLPQPGDKLEVPLAKDELMGKIEEDRKKRKGGLLSKLLGG